MLHDFLTFTSNSRLKLDKAPGPVERGGLPGLVPVVFEILILLVEKNDFKNGGNYKIRAKTCIKMTQTTVYSQ